ncbi:hypothetical protein DdX_09861 [Ditylenchus destructor]|uniref:Uncharacterized protein n=1 Tax=Ditylenchus destructor TaxID=166010 RepID=A0AAD4QZM4_9BILA|nr:hypothetical protein DdX_09861 [Ditylenchus destructor]
MLQIYRTWYLCNKQLVEVETQQYWWGRAGGCDFLRKSCFELIHEPSQIDTVSEYPKMSEVRAQIDYDSPELDEDYEDTRTIYPLIEDDKSDTFLAHSEQMPIPLPFCDERDLFFEVALHAPKKVCLSNGTAEMSYTVHCQILTKLKVVPESYQPITLESQLPDLVPLLNKQALNTYGSDYDHRYCPLPKAVIEGQLKNVPWNAKFVNCEHDHLD